MHAKAELAAEQAWHECLSRMTASQAQALRSYQDHMSKLGKGTGKYASRFRKLAAEAMAVAGPAVPAWVMPLPQVLETVPPDRDSFDVVIVDEASQASIESLFLLWLAPRVIVVGDDKQCAPSAVSHGALAPIFAKLASYLPHLPAYLRDVFTPKSSLFDLLGTRFGAVIRLREHFRCMPEIIAYSSRQFYADEPLVPLRQFGADRLPPLRVARVHGATTEGSSTKLRNEVEAEHLVERMIECFRDPAYDGKTFGVVVLQGSGQVQLIHDKLLEQIEPREWDRRRLRVGTPPDFQGDERDVIFLSLVIAERRTALTRQELQRRFNVAASRAKDQMWLFHSVSPDLLSPKDLRRSLLAYMLNPPAALAKDSLDHVTADVLVHPFDSLFEQRVFLRIRDRGYHVTPQVDVGGRRIDLVVSGAKGRLAVECDGDHWHSTPEDRENDLDRERELKRAGWRFWRIRESEFYFDQEAALKSLWEDLARRGIGPNEVEDLSKDTNTETVTSAPRWSAIELPDEEGWDGLDDGDPSELDEFVLSTPPARTRPSERKGGARTITAPAAGERVQKPEPIQLRPVPADAEVRSTQVSPPLRPGRAISVYSRQELQALTRWVSADGQGRTEEELVMAVADVLNSPSRRRQVEAQLRGIVRGLTQSSTSDHKRTESGDEYLEGETEQSTTSKRPTSQQAWESVPEGHRSVAWLRPEEAESALEAYQAEESIPIRYHGKVTGWARYHPEDSDQAGRYHAKVSVERARAQGPRIVCWVKTYEAMAVLDAARLHRDVPIADPTGRYAGLVQYFPPESVGAQRFRSVTRLLRGRNHKG